MRFVLCAIFSTCLCSCGGSSSPPAVVTEGALFGQSETMSETEGVDQRLSLATVQVLAPVPSPAIARPPAEFHDEESITRGVLGHLASVRDCASSHQFMGAEKIVLYLEIDQSGTVLGGSSLPQGGLEGVSALSACILPLAKRWVFPSRTTPGRTIVSIPLGFSVLK